MAFIRALSEQPGPESTTITWTYLAGGGGGGGRGARSSREGWVVSDACHWKYLWGCGALFVAYTTCYCLAVGLATDRSQVLAVGLVNYLWPSLTLLLSVPILRYRARWFLVPGMLVATAGMVVATTVGSGLSLAGLRAGVSANGLAYGLAFVGAVTWALYSNLARRWGGEGGAVPLFVLASGLVALPLRVGMGETSAWSPGVVGELLYMALFVTVVAYVFWDQAMRRGNVVLVAAVSYATPLLSTVFSAAYLRVAPGPAIWVACALVIAGAAVCRLAVRERLPDP